LSQSQDSKRCPKLKPSFIYAWFICKIIHHFFYLL